MPVQECTLDGKPGFRWGQSGRCYTYTPGDEDSRNEAKRRAHVQGYAIEQSGGEGRSMNDVSYRKAFPATIKKIAPQESDLEAMRQYAPGDVTAEDYFCGTMEVCNDQYDRAHERFTPEYLQRFAETLPGKSLLPGHNYEELPLGRFYDAKVVRTERGHSLIGKFFVDAQDSKTVRGISLGVYRDSSIGYTAGGRACDLCGEEYHPMGKAAGANCEHWPGMEFDGKLCTLTYIHPEKAEARETSLVWLGCQPGAQILQNGVPLDLIECKAAWTKSAGTPKEKTMADDVEEKGAASPPAITPEMKALMEDGQKYRDWLKAEIARKYGAVEMESTGNAMIAALAQSNADALKAVDADAQKLYDQKFPPAAHSQSRTDVQPPTDPTQGQQQRRFKATWGRA